MAQRKTTTPTPTTATATTKRAAIPPRKCNATAQIAKPNRNMLRTIASITKPEGKFNGAKRFHLYRKGMTLQGCKEANGLTHLDVLQYVKWEMMTLADCTDAAYTKAVKQWQAAKDAAVAQTTTTKAA